MKNLDRMTAKGLEVSWLGLMSYGRTAQIQREAVDERHAGETTDRLFLMEHYPVVTLGRGGAPDQLLVSEGELRRRGISFCRADRGGGAAYHGPGQLTVYGVIDLNEGRDIHGYLRRLEAVAVKTLGRFGLRATARPGLTGVWVGERKIGSIGIRVERWVTSHGIALNIFNDLAPYKLINQCGLTGVEPTSVAALLGAVPTIEEAADSFAADFCEVFGYRATRPTDQVVKC